MKSEENNDEFIYSNHNNKQQKTKDTDEEDILEGVNIRFILNSFIFSLSIWISIVIIIILFADNLNWQNDLIDIFFKFWNKNYITDINFIESTSSCSTISDDWEDIQFSNIDIKDHSCVCTNNISTFKEQLVIDNCLSKIKLERLHPEDRATYPSSSHLDKFFYYDDVPLLKCELIKENLYKPAFSLFNKRMCIKRSSVNFNKLTNKLSILRKKDRFDYSSLNDEMLVFFNKYEKINIKSYLELTERPIIDIKIVQENILNNNANSYKDYIRKGSLRSEKHHLDFFNKITENYYQQEFEYFEYFSTKKTKKLINYEILVKYLDLSELVTVTQLEELITDINIFPETINDKILYTRSDLDIGTFGYDDKDKQILNNRTVNFNSLCDKYNITNYNIYNFFPIVNRLNSWKEVNTEFIKKRNLEESWNNGEYFDLNTIKNTENGKIPLSKQEYENISKVIEEFKKLSKSKPVQSEKYNNKLPLSLFLDKQTLIETSNISDYNNLNMEVSLSFSTYLKAFSCLGFKNSKIHLEIIKASLTVKTIYYLHLIVLIIFFITETIPMCYKKQSVQTTSIFILVNLIIYFILLSLASSTLISISNFQVYYLKYKEYCYINNVMEEKTNFMISTNQCLLILLLFVDIIKVLFYFYLSCDFCSNFIYSKEEIKGTHDGVYGLFEEMMNLNSDNSDKETKEKETSTSNKPIENSKLKLKVIKKETKKSKDSLNSSNDKTLTMMSNKSDVFSFGPNLNKETENVEEEIDKKNK